MVLLTYSSKFIAIPIDDPDKYIGFKKEFYNDSCKCFIVVDTVISGDTVKSHSELTYKLGTTSTDISSVPYCGTLEYHNNIGYILHMNRNFESESIAYGILKVTCNNICEPGDIINLQNWFV